MALHLVTGGAGFIGSHVAARLMEEGHRVRVLDNLSTGRQENLDFLARTHGDFHPFNVVFEEGSGTGFTLLDASRGCLGDPADDVTCMSVNYLFFAADARRSWARGLGPLWRRFWEVYLSESGDSAVLEASPPWLAWRSLVVASPRFYPHLPAEARDTLLSFAERALGAGRLDPAWAEELFP